MKYFRVTTYNFRGYVKYLQIFYTLRQAYAAVVAIMILVLAVLPGHPLYFTTLAGILTKFYSNSMMVILNNRMRIGADAHPETNNTVTHLRSDNRTHGMDAFELGKGVLITCEEMVFPCDPGKVDGTGSQMNKSSYIVWFHASGIYFGISFGICNPQLKCYY